MDSKELRGAVMKARGLLPRGGSKKMQRRVEFGDGKGSANPQDPVPFGSTWARDVKLRRYLVARQKRPSLKAKLASLGYKVEKRQAEPPPFTFTFEFEKSSPTGKHVRGWASVIEIDGEPVCDVQGDIISMDELRKAAHNFISKARVAKAMHDGDQVGDVVESALIDDEFAKAHGITHGKRGWWIGMEINDPLIQKKIRDKVLLAFSIGGSGKRTPIE